MSPPMRQGMNYLPREFILECLTATQKMILFKKKIFLIKIVYKYSLVLSNSNFFQFFLNLSGFHLTLHTARLQ